MSSTRKYQAASVHDAIQQVKRELGPHAVILETRHLPGVGGRTAAVEITAAPSAAPTPAARRRARHVAPLPLPGSESPPEASAPAALPEQVFPYFARLVQNEVSAELALRLLSAAARTIPERVLADDRALREVLRRCIERMVPTAELPALAPGQCRRIAFVGPPGAGKTSTVAKLAAQLKLAGAQVGVLVLGPDAAPAAARLRQFVDTLDVPLYCAATLPELAGLRQSLDAANCLLIDTAGVGLREQGRFARLASLLRATRADEVHLVLPVSLAASVQARVARSFAPLNVSRVVLTRLDEAIGCGVILNVVDLLKCQLSYLAGGQNLTRDLEPARSGHIANLILTPQPTAAAAAPRLGA